MDRFATFQRLITEPILDVEEEGQRPDHLP
jgi:hypothetical protein